MRRLGPEGPNRAAGHKVALKVERVVDWSLHRKKALPRSARSSLTSRKLSLTEIETDRMPDNAGRELVASIRDRLHAPALLRTIPPRPPCRDSGPHRLPHTASATPTVRLCPSTYIGQELAILSPALAQ